MQSRFFLDVVVRQSSTVFQLFACKDQSLLFRWDSLFILNLRFNVLNSIIRFHIEGDGLSSQSFHENLHRTTPESQDQMQSRFLLDVIIRQSSAVFQLLASEDETLLLRR